MLFRSGVLFERYADDAIVHCRTRSEAERMRKAIAERLAECGLELNEKKTKIVYCRDEKRKGMHDHEKFTFLGYEFRARQARRPNGSLFTSFLPAVSPDAVKSMLDEIRKWRLHRHHKTSMEELARRFNSVIQGWVSYYGKFYRSRLHKVFHALDMRLTKWARWKFKKLRSHQGRAVQWLDRLSQREPGMWEHWMKGGRSGTA